MTDARPKTIPKMPWNMGLLCSGIMGIMTIIAPVKMPAEPTPAMALPAMSTGELGATPQMSEPISKMRMLPRNALPLC